LDKLEGMRVFVAVAEGGSFVEASRTLDLSAPAVTRSIARLETELGVKLFHRTTRSIRMTESGQHYYADVKNILSSIEEAEAAVAGSYGDLQGTLMITAPVLFGQIYVVPIIADFLDANPKVTVSSMFYDQIADLLEDKLDVAVRLGHLSDSSLFATRVGSVRKIVCASPDYLAAHGQPKSPADLVEHAIVQSTAVEPSAAWAFNDKKVRIVPRYQCNQNNAAIRAAKLGVGLTRVMSYQAADAIDSGALIPVLREFEPSSIPVNIVYLEGRKANAKIKMFVDFTVNRLRENSQLNPPHGDR